MSKSLENREELDEDYMAIMGQSNSEAIRDLEIIHKNLQLIKAQTANRRNNLAKELAENKLNRRLELNKTISSILSNVMKQLAEAAKLEDELNGVETDIKTCEQDKLPKLERPKERVDSDEESDSSETTLIDYQPSNALVNFSPDLQALLQSAKKHSLKMGNLRKDDQTMVPTKKEKPDAISDKRSKVERVIIKKFPGETDGTYRLKLLNRCQNIMRPYGIPMYDFSISWASGHALCALIHHHEPDIIDESFLKCKNSAVTLEYVSGLTKLLGVEFDGSLVKFFQQKRPSYIKVFNFVDSLYRNLVTLP